MRSARMVYGVLAAAGLTMGAALNARASPEYPDQCYRRTSEAPGTCSICKREECGAGTYCCKISVPATGLGGGEEETVD